MQSRVKEGHKKGRCWKSFTWNRGESDPWRSNLETRLVLQVTCMDPAFQLPCSWQVAGCFLRDKGRRCPGHRKLHPSLHQRVQLYFRTSLPDTLLLQLNQGTDLYHQDMGFFLQGESQHFSVCLFFPKGMEQLPFRNFPQSDN